MIQSEHGLMHTFYGAAFQKVNFKVNTVTYTQSLVLDSSVNSLQETTADVSLDGGGTLRHTSHLIFCLIVSMSVL